MEEKSSIKKQAKKKTLIPTKKVEKQKVEQALKHGREVAEGEKIRVYLNQINETFRKKRK